MSETGHPTEPTGPEPGAVGSGAPEPGAPGPGGRRATTTLPGQPEASGDETARSGTPEGQADQAGAEPPVTPGDADGVPPADADGADPTSDEVPAEDADAGPEPADTGTRAWGARLLRAGPWLVAALAIVVAAVSTFGYWQVSDLAALDRDREAVERAAGEFVLDLTNWDATEGMGDTRERLRQAGTERFAGEVDELFGTTEDLAGLAELEATSSGEVRRTFVQEIDGDRASALVVVDQHVTSNLSDEAERSRRYAEVELVRATGDGVGLADRLRGLVGASGNASEWLVDEVELLIEAGRPETGGVGPGAEAP